MSTKNQDGMMVLLKTSDSMEKVHEFYKQSIKEQGWETENALNMPQGIMLMNKKTNANWR